MTDVLSPTRFSVGTWRTEGRAALLAARAALSPARHKEASAAVNGQLARLPLPGEAKTVGFYWQYRGEVSVLPYIELLIAAGSEAALPVVVGRGQPLQFRRWSPDCALAQGAFNIPYPAEGKPVQPQVLLVPLLGFDRENYRLGYGGGYYDRTLAEMTAGGAKPRTIGIGLEIGRLTTIHPQSFDVAMDCIVTEAGVQTRPTL